MNETTQNPMLPFEDAIGKWVSLFKIQTWEELKAMSNQYMESAAKTIFELSADQCIQEYCLAHEEYETYKQYRNRQLAEI